MVAQLTKLGELKAQGILTEEEFAAQKAKILGSELLRTGRLRSPVLGGRTPAFEPVAAQIAR